MAPKGSNRRRSDRGIATGSALMTGRGSRKRRHGRRRSVRRGSRRVYLNWILRVGLPLLYLTPSLGRALQSPAHFFLRMDHAPRVFSMCVFDLFFCLGFFSVAISVCLHVKPGWLWPANRFATIGGPLIGVCDSWSCGLSVFADALSRHGAAPIGHRGPLSMSGFQLVS